MMSRIKNPTSLPFNGLNIIPKYEDDSEREDVGRLEQMGKGRVIREEKKK